MADTVSLKLTGTPIANPPLPNLLQPATRAAGAVTASQFLPDGYLKVDAAYDISARGRATPEGVIEKTLQAGDDQVVVLEMADGVTVITSGKKLKESLQRIDPGAVEDGTIKLSALRDRGEATRSIIGDAVSDLVSRVFTLTVGEIADPIIDAAKRKAAEWLGEKVEEKILEYPGLGVTWLGTKALMWAIESRLDRKPGLYRWPRGMGQAVDLLNVDANALAADAKEGPLLVFIHGTGSSSTGSFGDLQKVVSDDWQALERKFGERIYAFEHYTFSKSPIENAIDLVTALPAGAQINLVSHSRGGLVGDLVCLQSFSDELIENFKSDLPGPGDVLEDERERIEQESANAHAEHRARLREFRALLQSKQLVIQRYVRVAAPARGTLLATGNFDIFLSALLTLIGRVPYLYGNPLYYALKRIVLEIAKNRTNAKLVPGIEAMLPESPMARFLAAAKPQESTRMAVIAGDIEGGGLLKRLGVLFTDYAFFSGVDNDLVVDTDSMYAGIARQANGRALFDQGPAISHFHYFQNDQTRAALRDWLTSDGVEQLELFKALPGELQEPTLAEEQTRSAQIRRSRGGEAAEATLPIVVVLPGIMGSHLWKNENDRIWFDLSDIASGGLRELRWSAATGATGDGITAEKLFDMSYGNLCEFLMDTHRVERFPYDWRLPLDMLAARLEIFLRKLLEETANPRRPIRILAHSMGGLVVRALIHKLAQKNDKLWDDLMNRDGARFIMLGTPNQGSHSMVEALIGKSDTLRNLARLDLRNDLQTILDIIGEFRGALQLLPRPGFRDVGGAQFDDYFTAPRWSAFKADMKDFWFGDNVAATPSSEALTQGSWLWTQDNGVPALPARHQEKTVYVHGQAPNTPCGIKKIDDRWKMIGTPKGDGTVTWDSGAIGGIGQRYYMPAVHGDLADTDEYFGALAQLLSTGKTDLLSMTEPAVRGAETTMAYEAGPPRYPMPEEAAHALMGKSKRKRLQSRPVPTLKVKVKAMDLRFVTQPIMVGHYEQDAISGAEALIDSDLVGNALSERYNLGLYAGPIGTAVVVLRTPNEAERGRGSFIGAVVTGLGTYDGTLATNTLTEAVQAGALRYLLQYLDCTGESAGEMVLCSLLLGYNSTANLSVQASVEALVRGVVEANRKFRDATHRDLRIGSLEIIEVYLDTAISAMHVLREMTRKAKTETGPAAVRLEVPDELEQGKGARQRLNDSRAVGYWPRMIVTDADRDDELCPPECFERLCPPECYEDPCECQEGEKVADPGPKQPAWLRRRLALADRLKFVHVGQRARAETIVQQRQPGLVETLVAQQIQEKAYREEFCRTLFQLMVPHDFKDAARQLDRIVLVVDGYTANFPWELMLAEKQPMAVCAPMIRQLSSSKFRRQVRQSLQPLAYVVGNPSTENFFKAFPAPNKKAGDGLVSLDGAEREAKAVVESLRRYGYNVEPSIGSAYNALKVINPLYQKPYRVLHVAAHGVFDLRAADGKARSGVVLSDGLLLTAAEIGQMEIVPDLVFLNCCHLAKMDARPVAYNRLAYSISRELIEIGVRCVVCAGWAVDDDAACTFADTFYQGILHERLTFGDAVFEARKETYRRHGGSITWGAYQAYGDPGWRINPRDGSSTSGKNDRKFVAPEEMIEAIDRIRLSIYRRRESLTKPAARSVATQLQQLASRCPKDWLERPEINFALAEAYADLGADFFEKACELCSAAILAEDKTGRVPIKAIERLANYESRLGEQKGKPDLVDRAVKRLEELNAVAAQGVDYASGEKAAAATSKTNIERYALVGGAYKRKAAIYARQILDPQNPAREESIKHFEQAIRDSIAAYKKASGTSKEARFDPYPALNWLALTTLEGAYPDGADDCALCAKIANERFARQPNLWDAVMAAEAYMVESLCSGALGKTGESERSLERVMRHYTDALANLQFAPKDLESVTQQLAVLALLFDAKSKSRAQAEEAEADRRVALALRQLAEKIVPGSTKGYISPAPNEAAATDKQN